MVLSASSSRANVPPHPTENSSTKIETIWLVATYTIAAMYISAAVKLNEESNAPFPLRTDIQLQVHNVSPCHYLLGGAGMRFVQQNGQWALQFTLDWEVDMLSKLPENGWAPITYVGDSQIIGAIHVGTLDVRFINGRHTRPELPFTMLCPFPQLPKMLDIAKEAATHVGEN